MSDQNKFNINTIKDLTKEQFDALNQISSILNSSKFEESLIENALDWIIKIVNAERGLFVKYLIEDNDIKIISARNVNKESISNISEFSSGILMEVIDKKEPILYHDAQSDPTTSQFESVQIRQIKSVIGVPILYQNKVWGVILADSRSNRKEFTEKNLMFLRFFSNLFSLALDKIIEFDKLSIKNEILINKLQTTEQIPDIIGESKPMRNLAKLIHKVARTDATVLILGESGTGKDLVAQAIHTLSNRADNPFLGQFCGSIPDNLLESELFGFKKGAFTGANSDKKGLLEVADGGTFFLDEIADISMALQAKLLRVLENKEIMRLGDTQFKKIDVRLIAATNKDLQKMSTSGEFREDLFYRLNVFPIKLPPLRERKSDIPLLVDKFIKIYSNEKITLQSSALKKIQNYYWPGNIRQLMNVIQRAVILCEDNRITEDLIILEDEENDFNGTLKDFEISLLKKRLKEFDGNKTLTAKSLGVSVRWIQLKLKEIGE